MKPHWILIAALLVASPAAAQPTAAQVAEAQQLFDEGRRLMEAGRPGEACPKFERSQDLDPGRGTLINLAACYEAVGKLASALRAFREVADQARAAGDKKRLDVAAERARDLDARVPRLVVVLGDAPRPEGFALTLDGVPVALAEAGELLVDPGRVVIAASAPGYESFEQTFTLQPDGARTTVEVPALAPVPRDEALVYIDGRPTVVTTERRRTRTRTIAGLATAGAGALAVGGSVVLALGAKDSYDDALAAHCGGATDGCTPTGYDRTQAARRRGTVATIVGGVGLAAIAGGLVVWLTAPTEEVQVPRRAQVVPTLGEGGAGLALSGSF